MTIKQFITKMTIKQFIKEFKKSNRYGDYTLQVGKLRISVEKLENGKINIISECGTIRTIKQIPNRCTNWSVYDRFIYRIEQ